MKGSNEDEATGIAIVKRALEEPLRQIVENAGIEGSIVVQKVKEGKGDFGFNARTEEYEKLLQPVLSIQLKLPVLLWKMQLQLQVCCLLLNV